MPASKADYGFRRRAATQPGGSRRATDCQHSTQACEAQMPQEYFAAVAFIKDENIPNIIFHFLELERDAYWKLMYIAMSCSRAFSLIAIRHFDARRKSDFGQPLARRQLSFSAKCPERMCAVTSPVYAHAQMRQCRCRIVVGIRPRATLTIFLAGHIYSMPMRHDASGGFLGGFYTLSRMTECRRYADFAPGAAHAAGPR